MHNTIKWIATQVEVDDNLLVDYTRMLITSLLICQLKNFNLTDWKISITVFTNLYSDLFVVYICPAVMIKSSN